MKIRPILFNIPFPIKIFKENKINIECEEFFKPLIDMINSKFRDILKAEFVIKKGEEKKDEKEEKEDEKEMINNV